MKYGSVCSGIEAASLAWAPLGWQPAWFSEIDPFACAVLRYRYSEVPNLGDFTQIDASAGPIDILVGGTPCQDFSVAGLRAGLAGERGHLTVEFVRLCGRLLPRWVVWENVPGVLSADGGRAFGTFVGLLAERGYCCAWRVCDAQYWGVPQRRRRVFLVGYLGDWRPPIAVLFERASLSGHPAPRREAGQGVAPCLEAVANRTGGPRPPGTTVDTADGLIAHALTAHGQSLDGESETFVAHTLTADGFDASGDGTGRGTPLVPVVFHENQRGALKAGGGKPGQGYPAIAFSCKDSGLDAGELAPTLRAMEHDGSHANAGGQVAIATPMAVRRLTPVECERLMGMPDDWTLVPYRGKPAADGPRYRTLGNSMAVPVVRWIGERMQMVEDVHAAQERAA